MEQHMSMTSPGAAATASPWSKRLLWLAVGLGAVVATRFLPVEAWLTSLEGHIAALGAWGPIVFGVLYVGASLLLVPGSALTIAAGALFGLGLGTLTVSLAATAAAALAFPLARTLLRARIEHLVEGRASFRAIDDAIGDGGWRIVGLLRLSPVVPFALLNYALGLTKVRYVPAVLVSWLAMLPGTLLYVYIGAAGSEVARGTELLWREWTLLAVGLVATAAVTVILTRMARARMRERDLAPESAADTESAERTPNTDTAEDAR